MADERVNEMNGFEIKINIPEITKVRDVDEIIKNITERFNEEIAGSTNVYFDGPRKDSLVTGTVSIDGERIVKAMNELNQTMKRLIEEMKKADVNKSPAVKTDIGQGPYRPGI